MGEKINACNALSEREKQILELLALGLNQVQVADRIFLSPHTVNFHVRNILKKLATANVTAAVALALTLQLIKINLPMKQVFT